MNTPLTRLLCRRRIFAYDDIQSVYFFGSRYKGFWTQTYHSITDAMAAAKDEYADMVERSNTHDSALLGSLTAAAGAKYAAVSALAYRQTLAATKLVWNHDRSTMWNFLKEISTNGDMQVCASSRMPSRVAVSSTVLCNAALCPACCYFTMGTFWHSIWMRTHASAAPR